MVSENRLSRSQAGGPIRLSSRIVAAAVVGGLALMPAVRAAQAPREIPIAESALHRAALECGTLVTRDLRGGWNSLATAAALPEGEPLSFEQSPPLLSPDFTGTFKLSRFLILGDVSTVEFRRVDPDNSSGQIETWQRQTTTTVGGALASVFEPSWSGADLAKLLQRYVIGFDYPELYWGRLIVPGQAGVERAVFLRVSFSSIPASPVVRVNDQIQYSSNLVNIVLPGFEDQRPSSGSGAFDFAAAAKLFYQAFPDEYDSIAFVPAASAMGDFSAFHVNVKNSVGGLGISMFDLSAQFGSAGALQSVEMYGASRFAENAASSHEFAHQWGDSFDWTRLAGITPAGHQPTAHSPLWYAGETMIGAVLTGDRQVKDSGGSFAIERTPLPIHYHPIEMYSMGLLARDQVPDTRVFLNQAQFSQSSISTPDAGTAVQGDSRIVTINDIVREHGARSGPTPGMWRRATVVVSRAGLISQAEMNYWNYFAQRIGDRHHTGVLSVEGFGSPFSASSGQVALTTTVRPTNGSGLPETFEIDNPPFGPKDFRGVQLGGNLPTHYSVGQSVTVTGTVTAPDAVDWNQALIYFQKYGGSDDTVRFSGTISRSKDFSVTIKFTDAQKGRYIVGVALFWPDAGAQFGRTNLTPIVVE